MESEKGDRKLQLPVRAWNRNGSSVGPTSEVILEVEELSVRFGGVPALDGVSLKIGKGSVHALVGPNGAGKTTCFNCVTRMQQPNNGKIRFAGQDLLDHSPSDLAGMGIGRTFQHPQVCSQLTVYENVLLGYHARYTTSDFGAVVRTGGARREDERVRHEALHLLGQLGLETMKDRVAGELPYAALRRVELARALLGEPVLMLMDEPASGLTVSEVRELATVVTSLNSEQGVSVVFIEHNLRFVEEACHQVTVLSGGRVIAEGSFEQIVSVQAVRDVFIGRAR